MKTIFSIVLLLTSVAMTGCGTTRFESTWVEPDAGRIDMRGDKVAAIMISSSESTRRAAEDTLAAELTGRGAIGVAGYTLIPKVEPLDPQAARKILQSAGISGAVVMRLLGTEKETYYVPGTTWYRDPYYRSFDGYWGASWPAVYDPGYVQTDTLVSVETLVYSVTDGRLIWSGISKTTNPSRIDSLIREIVDAVAQEMKKQGLIG